MAIQNEMIISLRLVSICLFGVLVGCIGTDFVDENPTANPEVEVTPPAGAIAIADTLRYAAVYRDEFEMVVDTARIVWTSSNPEIASIDANGVATGVSAGQSFITGMVGTVESAPAMLRVVADTNEVARIDIAPASQTLALGMSTTFTYQVFNIEGQELSMVDVTWSSSDPAVVSIDSSGNATALSAGTSQIVATADGVSSAASVVTVPGRSKSGSFMPAPGSSYTVSGTGRLKEDAQGGLIVEFDSDFVVSNGPDIQVYVSSTSNVTGSSTNLGLVKNPTGAQTYDVPSSVEYDRVNYIIIHCVSFNVTFGQAEVK